MNENNELVITLAIFSAHKHLCHGLWRNNQVES